MTIWILIAAVLSLGAANAQTPATAVTPPTEVSSGPVGSIDKGDGPVERPIVCFSAREMNDRVSRLRLHNPLLAMQSNARRLRAEPLRTRLCRTGNRLVYELSLIRRDGKVMQVYLNAQSGRPIAPPRS